MYATDMTQPFFNVKPSRASFATVARSGVSKSTWAILTFCPWAFGVGEGATCVVWNPWYLIKQEATSVTAHGDNGDKRDMRK